MAQFKVKNLMIDVVSADLEGRLGELCLFPTNHCPSFSLICPNQTFIGCFWRTINCLITDCLRSCFISDGCGLNYSTCFQTDIWIIDLKRLIINPDDITVVQDQLNQALKALGTRADEVGKNMRPQTIEQAEMLEQHLKQALDEVQRLKKELG